MIVHRLFNVLSGAEKIEMYNLCLKHKVINDSNNNKVINNWSNGKISLRLHGALYKMFEGFELNEETLNSLNPLDFKTQRNVGKRTIEEYVKFIKGRKIV